MPPDAQKAAGPAPEGASTPAPRRRRVRALIILSCALIAALVAGAAAVRPGSMDDDVLHGFQIRVLSISQAASENRMDGALAALQALEQDLNAAAAGGQVSAARYVGITDALAAVREDITSRMAAAAASEPAAVPDSAEATDAATVAAPEAAVQDVPASVDPIVPVVVPAPAPGPDAHGQQRSTTAKEAKGKGKDKGKH
ncbi:hypothetical protein [Pseudarthrobacter sp. C4D7]|uniref:hypothetical protein n=1 Tax=Pseudarthrobacter sp. C4D7 TaxID=2735268 RepID=UPI001584981D|nr:hypothetical protein [Pseudarthrobacter sp. C4D7]